MPLGRFTWPWRRGLVLLGPLALFGCGGGGGGETEGAFAPTASSIVLTAADFRTAEYDEMPALATIHADEAYGRDNTPGSGVTIAVLDDGLDTTHPEFAGRVVTQGDYTTDPAGSDATPSAGDSHGTHVTGIAAGAKDDAGMHGVAFSASIAAYKFSLSIQGATAANTAIDATDARVVNNSWGIDLGLNDVETLMTTLSVDASSALEAFGLGATAAEWTAFSNSYITLLDQAVVVFAISNDSGLTDADFTAALPELYPALDTGSWLTVVNVDASNALQSAPCGSTAAYCLAAPGVNVLSAVPSDSTDPSTETIDGRTYARFSGTSMAAPMVSGAAAILFDMFSLSSREVAARLLATADDTFGGYNAYEHGQGIIDLDAATQPIGNNSVVSNSLDGGKRFAIADSRMDMGAPFGDAMARHMTGRTLAVFDTMDAPFGIAAAHLVPQRPAGLVPGLMLDGLRRSHATRALALPEGLGVARFAFDPARQSGLRQPGDDTTPSLGSASLMAAVSPNVAVTARYGAAAQGGFGPAEDVRLDPALSQGAAVLSAPFMTFAERGYGLDGAWRLGPKAALRVGTRVADEDAVRDRDPFALVQEDDSATRAMAGLAELVVQHGPAIVNVQAGALQEQGTFLGSRTGGAFATDESSATVFAGLGGRVALSPSITLVASAHAGMTSLRPADGGLLTAVSAVTADAYALGLMSAFAPRSTLGFLVSQPLRVAGGDASMRWVSGRTRSRQLLTEDLTFDLEPSGRELDVELLLSLPLGRGMLSTTLMHRREPGHVAGADSDQLFLLRLDTPL